jgi:hypothetical protein
MKLVTSHRAGRFVDRCTPDFKLLQSLCRLGLQPLILKLVWLPFWVGLPKTASAYRLASRFQRPRPTEQAPIQSFCSFLKSGLNNEESDIYIVGLKCG